MKSSVVDILKDEIAELEVAITARKNALTALRSTELDRSEGKTPRKRSKVRVKADVMDTAILEFLGDRPSPTKVKTIINQMNRKLHVSEKVVYNSLSRLVKKGVVRETTGRTNRRMYERTSGVITGETKNTMKIRAGFGEIKSSDQIRKTA